MREVKVGDIIIELEEIPRFFKYEVGKTYEVEIDLQRFPIIRKFRMRSGEEYPACIYNIRVLKENGKVVDSEWRQRRIGVGDCKEDKNSIRVKPRMFSEFWQLARIYNEFGAGIHKCIVKTKKGDRGQVLTRIIHSKDCSCLKSGKKEGRKETDELRVYHPQEIAERLKEKIKEERVVAVRELADEFNTDEETVRKALDILVKEGFAVNIRENKYYLSPKSE